MQIAFFEPVIGITFNLAIVNYDLAKAPVVHMF